MSDATVSIAVPGGTVVLDITSTFTATPVAAPPAQSPKISYVYKDGVFSWPGDWSTTAYPDGNAPVMTANYKDTVGNPGGECLSLTTITAWGYWLPYCPNQGPPVSPGNTYLTPSFDTTGYNYLSLDVKPTRAGQKWSMSADVYTTANGSTTGDIGTGVSVSDISKYAVAGTTVVGQWTTYKIPLSALGLQNVKNMYKFLFQDQTGLVGVQTYVNNVYFTS